jgi:hypothetical protein
MRAKAKSLNDRGATAVYRPRHQRPVFPSQLRSILSTATTIRELSMLDRKAVDVCGLLEEIGELALEIMSTVDEVGNGRPLSRKPKWEVVE